MIYYIARFLVYLYMKITCKVTLEGIENVPDDGPLLIFSNHPSAFDQFLIGCNIKRKVNYMAKAELFKNKFVGALFLKMGAFPVHRGKGDIGSVKTALKLLEKGEAVGVQKVPELKKKI
jgi:1-acyl-sn-glycerol-3-phosphate acyltransferase